jgi:hypothetical protein
MSAWCIPFSFERSCRSSHFLSKIISSSSIKPTCPNLIFRLAVSKSKTQPGRSPETASAGLTVAVSNQIVPITAMT